MRLKPALAILALALIAGVAVFGISLRSGMSLGFATPYLEAQVSRILGRRLSFHDAPQIQIKSGLHLSVSNVSLANADWAGQDDMLELRSITAHVDLSTLFDTQVVLETLLIDGLQLRLRENVDGLSNLPQIAGDDTEDTTTEPEHPLPVLIRHIQMSNVRIDRQNDATQQSMSLLIDTLSQEAPNKNNLVYQGHGSLQDKPWDLSIDGSGFSSLRSGLDMSATFSGSLGNLKLEGDYRLPNIRELQNLSFNATLQGPVPDRISALSPILEPNEAAQVVLHISDIDPGLQVDLRVQLPQITLQLSGNIDNPRKSDGLNLAVELDAVSLPRLAQALGLGETANVPLQLDGRLLRKDKRIELRDALLVAGDHQIQADIVLPAFPGTDGASVNFSAAGPDFSFYQRLFDRPANLDVPYTMNAEVVSDAIGAETVQGKLNVGQHTLQLSGLLENFPSYAGSHLALEFHSPSLQAIASNAGVELPDDSPISVKAAVSVSDAAVVTVNSAEIVAFDFTSLVSGHFDSYPDFGNANLQFESQGASLATLGERFDIQGLGDLPLSIHADLLGSPQEIIVRNLRLDTGELHVQSSKGDLRYQGDSISSDLRLSVTLSNIEEILGSHAPGYTPDGTYTLDLLPRLSPSLFSLGLENLSGPGISGSAGLELASDFQLNDKTVLTADLTLDDISQLLPAIDGYTPPREQLFLRAVTRQEKTATRIDAQLLDAKGELLAADISLSKDFAQNGISLSLSGAGDDLRAFGTHATFPDQQLPYVIDLSANIRGQDLSAQARNIQLGGSRLSGTAHWESANQSLTADVQIPQAELQAWLPKDSEANAAPTPKAKDGRRIPDIALPLELLQDYRVDVSLETGPLGIMDPKFKTLSLVDESILRLQSGNGKGRLHIEKLVGSRGAYEATFAVNDTQAPAQVETNFTVRGMPIAIIGSSANFATLPRYDLTAALDANGGDLRALAATLNGEFLMTGSAGSLKKMKLSAATESFLIQTLQTLLPMLKSGNTNMEVECTVLGARATDGILTLDPGFVFRSAEIDLSAEGKVNLRNEKLGIRFTNRARKGLGISAASLINPYVEVTGTLGKPALGLDITSSAISGGAAVASGGITLLAKPLYERFLQTGNPCDAALKRWKETAN